MNNTPRNDLPTITQNELDRLVADGHCVYVYPRLREARVDGFKRYRLNSTCPSCGIVVGSTTTVVIDATPPGIERTARAALAQVRSKES